MRCSHTGLPAMMCAHCNGVTGLVREPFRGVRPDEEPRLFKGRDKVEWKGIGRSLGSAGDVRLTPLYKGSCVRRVGTSAWAQENILRSAAEIVRGK